ncbi:dual specificity protein phosphatase 18-like [Condylostylus longicornis]|uniref:dual specificity protein phosphatase 18-like n=1 Tax=Condylostylus longicornis TaxID=2530218 RepID=UPI00244DCCE3|nr:dual specificity protein phosphatase 18-like [Condylostylus longicornis]
MKVITITANPLSSSTPSARKAETVITEIDTTTSKSTEIQDILKACENRENLSDESSQLRFPGISEILPTLYLCGAGVAIPSIMEKLDIKCVVNVAPELPDTPLPNNKPVYLRVNVYDRRDADLKTYFDEVADLIEEVRQTNGKSLVHCVAGVSRSASLCIAYLIKHMKMSLRDAYLHVKNARPQIRPNLGFFQQLLEYEEELRGEKSVKMIFVKSLDREIPDVFEPEYRAMEEFYQKCRRHYETIRR